MQRTAMSLGLALCLLGSNLFFSPTGYADEKAQYLAGYLPQNINSLCILRLGEILASPRGEQEQWAVQLEEQFLAGSASVPAWVDTLVIGSLLHPARAEEVWATGVMQRPESLGFDKIAQHAGSAPQILAGRQVVPSNKNSYFVDLPGSVLGVYRPAHRQEVSMWIRSLHPESQSTISPYLQEALNATGHLVLSINLLDMFDPQFVQSHLEQDSRFASHQKVIAQLTPLLTGLRGVTLIATVDSQTRCDILIDFSEPVEERGAIVKTLFLTALEDLGASIEEFTDSKISLEGNTIRLTCSLSDASLRRLMSLIITPQTPHALQQAATEGPTTSPPAEQAPSPEELAQQSAQQKTRAARRYVSAVNKMIDDLQRANRNAKNYQATITWHETFARKIESLSTQDVPRELLQFGQQTADHFRALASSLRGQGIRVSGQEQALTFQYNYQPSWMYANIWGGAGYRPPSVHVQSNLQEVREQQAAAVTAGALEREEIWNKIQQDRQQAEDFLKSQSQ